MDPRVPPRSDSGPAIFSPAMSRGAPRTLKRNPFSTQPRAYSPDDIVQRLRGVAEPRLTIRGPKLSAGWERSAAGAFGARRQAVAGESINGRLMGLGISHQMCL